MNDFLVPRRAERFLESLGADAAFRDEITGDLAEEFAERVQWDGPLLARRWYIRESIRVAPYLIRDWWHRADAMQLARIAGAVVMAFVSTRVLEGVVQYPIRHLLGTLMKTSPIQLQVMWFALMLAWTVGDGIFAGWLVARLSRRSPAAATLAMTGTWFAFMAIIYSKVTGAPIVFAVLNTMALSAGTLAGGLIQMWSRPDAKNRPA